MPPAQGGSDSKASAYNEGDPGSIPGWGRSSGEGSGSPLQDSCLENPMDGGTWEATVHGVAQSRTRLSDFTHTSDTQGWREPLCGAGHFCPRPRVFFPCVTCHRKLRKQAETWGPAQDWLHRLQQIGGMWSGLLSQVLPPREAFPGKDGCEGLRNAFVTCFQATLHRPAGPKNGNPISMPFLQPSPDT